MKKAGSLIAFAFGLVSAVFAQPPQAELPVRVPDINGMAISLAKPAFPETAVVMNADGDTTIVMVVVDENGVPVSATCSLNCHPMLKDAAEQAALTSRFKPLVVKGRAVKYEGTLHFTFVVERVNWFRFGTALESTRQFDNLSLGPVAQMLSPAFAEEKQKLLSLDGEGVDLEKRWKVIADVTTSVRSKLKDDDLWRFNLSLALRQISFWTMAAAKTDRVELQKAIDALPAVTAAAPEGTSEKLIDGLREIAKFRVPQETDERELRRSISELMRKIQTELR